MDSPIFFTVHGSEPEQRVTISKTDDMHRLIVGGREIIIDSQQLGELGALFLSLAGDHFDPDSVLPLLNGYEISIDPLADACENIALAAYESHFK